jgi:hypothetical protein
MVASSFCLPLRKKTFISPQQNEMEWLHLVEWVSSPVLPRSSHCPNLSTASCIATET